MMITNPRLLVNCIMRENDLPLTQNSGQRKAPLPETGEWSRKKGKRPNQKLQRTAELNVHPL